MEEIPRYQAVFLPPPRLWPPARLGSVEPHREDHRLCPIHNPPPSTRPSRASYGRRRAATAAPQTLRTYCSDLTQLAVWLLTDNPLLVDSVDVAPGDLNASLVHLAEEGLSSVSRARKLAPTREVLRFLRSGGVLDAGPIQGADTPRPEEYKRLLAAAGVRDSRFRVCRTVRPVGGHLDDARLQPRLLGEPFGRDAPRRRKRDPPPWIASRRSVLDPHFIRIVPDRFPTSAVTPEYTAPARRTVQPTPRRQGRRTVWTESPSRSPAG
jgi:hypothetical protein